MIRTNENILLTSKKSTPWWKSVSIEPVVFLYMLAIHLNIPTDEALLYQQVCYKLYNISLCNSLNKIQINQTNIENIIQKYASIYVMYFNFVYTIPSIFITMIYGIWSDKYSHKIPMILANIGCILATLVNLFVSILKYNISIEILFLSNLFFSLFGSTSTMFSIIYNYLSHITTIENRTQKIAIIESCLMFGSTIGLILSGILVDLMNFQFSFLIIIFIHLINIIYIIFYVKEVIQIKENILIWKNFYKSLCIYNDIKDSYRILFKQREFYQRKYLLLALIGLLFSM
jgi:MFS family permease